VKALRCLELSVCWVLLFGNATLALAQEAVEEPPLRRKTIIADPYAPKGIDTNGLQLFPSLEIGAVVTSNVKGSSTDKKADIGFRLKPTLRFASDWTRHSWTGSATGDFIRYAKESDFSTLSGSLDTAFRLDIRRTTRADLAASYAVTETGTSDSQVPNSAKGPRRNHNFNAAAGLTHDFGGLEGSVKTALARALFEDVELNGGGKEDNKDRNYWAPSVTLRAGLTDPGSAFNPYAEISYEPRFHDQTKDRNGLKRDSQGLALSAGVVLNRGPIWDGDIALTYLVRSYADASLETTQALGATGRIIWRPTELTTIDATSSVALDETATAGISASRSWANTFNVTYALRENINLSAGAGFTVQDTGTQYDKSTTAKLGLDWKLNPNMTAGITYQGLWFNSGTAGNDYDDQRVLTSIVLQR
jgi:hypothetical protein